MLLKESKEVLIVSNALNVMYVEGVESGVCSFYVTLYTEYRFNVKGVKSELFVQGLQEERLFGFSSSPPVSLRRQLCYFLGLVKL